MDSDRRGSARQWGRVLAVALLLPALSACAPAVGGGVLVAVVAIGALTSHCYDYADVTVYDPRGHRTCAATVTATNRRDSFELKSCYYAPLTDGHWVIRAHLPGFPDTVSAVDVDHENDCTRHVQSMELTIEGPGGAAPPTPTPPPFYGAPIVPGLPPPPAPPPQGPPPATAPPPPAAPPASSAPPPPPGASSAPPAPPAPPAASSAPPSVGVFPDQGLRPSPPK